MAVEIIHVTPTCLDRIKYVKINVLLCCCLMATAYAEDPPHPLEEFADKQLNDLKDADFKKLADAFKAATGDELKNEKMKLLPHWLRKFGAQAAQWMLAEVYPGFEVPDVSYMRVHVFDKDWKRIAKAEFPTGYRMFIEVASIVRSEELAQDVLTVKTTSAGPFMIIGDTKKPAFEQGDFQIQHYALCGEKLVLVRITDNDGNLVENSYRWRMPMKGPPVPKRTAEESIKLLQSKDPVEVLSVLVWLTGSHLPSAEARNPTVNQESAEDSKIYEDVRDAAETKKAAKKLASSKNSWVSGYAKILKDILEKKKE